MSAPRRLLEDPETAEALRTDLQAAAAHQVGFDVTAGLTRFEAALAHNAAAASTSGLKATLMKLGVAGVVGGAAIGVALYSGSPEAPEPANPVATVAPQPPVATLPPQTSEPSVQAPATEPSEAMEEPAAAPEPPARAAPKRPVLTPERPPRAEAKPAPTQTRDDLLDQEVQQLREIRQMVGSNPNRALKLANEGHVRFKGGVLYQEREALALQALSQLGRKGELEQRGERYLRTFPNGSFSNRVRQLLGR